MIQPALRDDAFLADVASASDVSDGLCFWWLGQSGYLVQYQGHRLLLDPYLSDSLTHKYAATDKPHVRMTERVVSPDRLEGIEAVTASHHHTDHLDPETLQPLARANPLVKLVCPEAHRKLARERSALPDRQVVGLDAGEEVELGAFKFIAVPAAHESLDRDKAGKMLYLGWVIRVGPWTLYHSGDTLLYPGMEDLLRPYEIDLAFLPINGRAPERRVAGNLNGLEAARLALAIGAKRVIPCHYDMFEFNTASPDEFIAECQRLGQPSNVLRAGERFVVGTSKNSSTD